MEYVVFISSIIVLIIIAKILFLPIKIISKLLLNVLIGIILLILVNSFFGMSIPFNYVTAAISGILGLPGVILLIILEFIA